MLQAERTSGGNTIAECLRCGCFFAYQRKPKLDSNGNPIEPPANHVERGSLIACPACGYYPKALLAKGKTIAFFTLLFVAVFPALMLMFAQPLYSQAHLISEEVASLIFNLCLYAVIGIGGLAVLAGIFYHPTRAPFKRWEKQGRVLQEGRPRDQWHTPDEMVSEAAKPSPVTVAPPKVEESVADIAPPPDFVPPKSRDDEDEEEEAAAAAAVVPPSTTGGQPRPMPKPVSATGTVPAKAGTDMVVLQCPQCQKKFRAPRSVLAQGPKCKVCHVPLNDVTGQHGT